MWPSSGLYVSAGYVVSNRDRSANFAICFLVIGISQPIRSLACPEQLVCFLDYCSKRHPQRSICSNHSTLTFGTIVSFAAPLFRPGQQHRWLAILGYLVDRHTIAVFSDSALQSPGCLAGFPWSGVSLRIDLPLCAINFLLCGKNGPGSVASPAELVAYLAFIVIRYHFI
jgi:hypothetical protein